jgi:zinc finger CCHC domain-containing protein 9
MVRVTNFARPKRTYDKDDAPRAPLPPQQSAYQSQKASQNPRSEARRLKRKAIRESDKDCFVCRQKGHLSQECPQRIEKGDSINTTRICYRCGRIDHSLKDCKKPPLKRKRENKEDSISGTEDDNDGDDTTQSEFLPFAKCYICQNTGHLAGFCPQNDRGIYPAGGGCKLCGISYFIFTGHIVSN